MTRNVGPIVRHRHLRLLVKSASNEKPSSRTTFPRGERIGKMGLPLSTAQLFTYVFVSTVLYSCVFTLSLSLSLTIALPFSPLSIPLTLRTMQMTLHINFLTILQMHL